MPINLEVTRHFSVVWLECRHLALKVVEWKASRHPTGLGYPVRNDSGSSSGPLPNIEKLLLLCSSFMPNNGKNIIFPSIRQTNIFDKKT